MKGPLVQNNIGQITLAQKVPSGERMYYTFRRLIWLLFLGLF